MAACASCGTGPLKQADSWQERLEYVNAASSRRLRVAKLRDPVCSKCAQSIADNVEATDMNMVAALEVTAKLQAYLGPHPSQSHVEAAWAEVMSGMERYMSAGEQLVLVP